MNLAENKLFKFIFILTIFLFCIGIACIRCTPDNDLWARLIAGGNIVENLSIIKYDFLSYTQTHPWYDHEWGASVVFYIVFKYFGDTGLIILKGLLSGLTVFICFKTVELNKPKSTSPYNILYFVFMSLAVFKSIGAPVRCLLFTCVFFALFLYILEKYKQTENYKYLILLPFIMIFWCNMHGGCISGLGLIGIYIIGEFLNKKPIKNYVYTLIACLCTLFINPYGFEYVKFLFFAAGMDRSMILEWASPFDEVFINKQLRYKLYLFVMLMTAIIYYTKNKIKYSELNKTKILLILVMTYLSATHIRHITFFVYTVGTLLYDEFYSLFNSIINKFNLIKNTETRNSLVLLKEICIYFIIFFISIPPLIGKNKHIRITETAYPRYAIEFIKINKIKGNLFVNFDWGSYAAYKLYPDNLIVMDGRYEEVYDPKLFIDVKNFNMLKDDWYKIINDYQTDVMIIDKKYPVFEKLLTMEDWVLVFENNLSGVFVPKANVKNQYLLPIPLDEYYNSTLFKTNAIKRKRV